MPRSTEDNDPDYNYDEDRAAQGRDRQQQRVDNTREHRVDNGRQRHSTRQGDTPGRGTFEYFKIRLDEVLDQRNGVENLRNDLIDSKSAMRRRFNSIQDMDEIKKAIVYFLDKIPLAERSFGDKTLLTRLFVSGNSRPVNLMKFKFRARLLKFTDDFKRAFTVPREWTVETLNELLSQTNSHYGQHSGVIFNVFIDAVTERKRVNRRGGIKNMLPEFNAMSKENFKAIVHGYNLSVPDNERINLDFMDNISNSEWVQASNDMSLSEVCLQPPVVGSSSISMGLPDLPGAGDGEAAYDDSGEAALDGSGEEYRLGLVQECSNAKYPFSFYLFNADASPVYSVEENTNWKALDMNYWADFKSYVETHCAYSGGCCSVVEQEDFGIKVPIMTIEYPQDFPPPSKIDIDCRMVVRMIAPYMTRDFQTQHNFSAVDQSSAANFLGAVLQRSRLWAEIQGWHRVGKPFLKNSRSLLVSTDSSGALDSTVLGCFDAAQCAAGLGMAAEPASVSLEFALGAAVSSESAAGAAVSSESAAGAAVSSESAAGAAVSLESAAGAAVSLESAAGAVVSSESSAEASVRPSPATTVETESREVTESVPSPPVPKRRRLTETCGDSEDIMDAISFLEGAFENFKKRLGKVLVDDSKFSQMQEMMEKTLLAMADRMENLKIQEIFQMHLREKISRDMDIVKSDVVEQLRTLRDLAHAQDGIKERFLRYQEALRLLREFFCDFSKDDCMGDFESILGTCKALSDGVKQFEEDYDAAKVRLTSVREEVATTEGTLAPLREERAAIEARLAPLRSEENDIKDSLEKMRQERAKDTEEIQKIRKELGNLRVVNEKFQQYKIQYALMMQRTETQNRKERELAEREALLLERERNLAASAVHPSPCPSVSLSNIAQEDILIVPRVDSEAAAGGDGGAAAVGMSHVEDEDLTLGAGAVQPPSSIGY